MNGMQAVVGLAVGALVVCLLAILVAEKVTEVFE